MEPFIFAAILAVAVVIIVLFLHRKKAAAKNDAEKILRMMCLSQC